MQKKFNFIVFIIAFLLLINPFMSQGMTAFATSENVDVGEVEENVVNYSIVISEETGEITLKPTEVEIEEGDTVLDALEKVTGLNDIELSIEWYGTTAYINGIDSLHEFDRGPGSGWMYRVNGVFPNRGAGEILLVPGDKVEWLYTTNLGQDLGANLETFRQDINPTIQVIGLTDNETVYDDQLLLDIEAKSYFGTPLSTSVEINNLNIDLAAEDQYVATLIEGENIINVTATDNDGRTITESYTIYYEKVDEQNLDEDDVEDNFVDTAQIESAIENATSFILNKGVTSEWEAIGLAQAGKDVPSSYFDTFYYNIEDQIVSGLDNGRIKITDIERLAMAAIAVGLDPQNVNGLNLIELIYNSPDRNGGFDTMTFQGNNGPIFALIALDTLSFPVPEDARWTRQDLIDELLQSQNEDGSWSLNPMYPDPSVDITGMALIGLSPYKEQPAVREALNSAVDWLSSVQTDNGGFDGGDFVGGITSEATSQVIIGLSSYGIDPAGEQFTKNGNNLIAHLLEYQNDDGGFKHTMDYDYSDPMATEQALQALVAYDYFLKGKGSLYQFDTIDDIDDEENLDDLDNNENRDEEETEQNERDDMNSEEANDEDEENNDENQTKENDSSTEKNEPVADTDESENEGNDSVNNTDENIELEHLTDSSNLSNQEEESKVQETLPQTANGLYGVLIAGFVLTLAGLFLAYYSRRRAN